MFKVLINLVVLFILLLINLGLFTWCVNQLLGPTPLKKTLINNVQAEASPRASESVPPIKVITQRPIRPSTYAVPSTQQGKPHLRLALQFQSTHIRLDTNEHLKLEKMLQRFNISSSHSVQIFSGVALSKNNIPSPQTAKLRAQTVARIIYPYTQTVKMFYRPSLEEGKVIVEFFEPQAPKMGNGK